MFWKVVKKYIPIDMSMNFVIIVSTVRFNLVNMICTYNKYSNM